MDNDSLTITLLCPACGSDQFDLPEGVDESNVRDDTVLTCAECGKVYTKKELAELNKGALRNNFSKMVNDNEDDLIKAITDMIRSGDKYDHPCN